MNIIIQVPTDRSSSRRYDWKVIFDGYRRELEQGIDFDCQPASFVRTVRRAARRRDIPVEARSYLRDRTTVVAVKAHPVSV
jgi:hypothetical protein